MEKEIPRIARDGNLIEMSRLLDSPDEKQKDTQGYEAARAEWAESQREIEDIEAGNINANEEAIQTAQRVAAFISVAISFITVVLVVVSRVM